MIISDPVTGHILQINLKSVQAIIKTATYNFMGTLVKQPSNCYQCTYHMCDRCLSLDISDRTLVYICTAQCVHGSKIPGHESNNERVLFLCFQHSHGALHTEHEMQCTPCTLEHTSAYNSVLTEHAFKKSMTDLPTDTVKVLSCLTHCNQSAKGQQNKRHIYLVNVTSIDKIQREEHHLAYESHLCKTASSNIILCEMTDSKINQSKVMNTVTDNVFTEHRRFDYQNYFQMKHMTTLVLLELNIHTLVICQRLFFPDAVFDKSLDSKFQNVIRTSISDNIHNATTSRTKKSRINGYCERGTNQRQLRSYLKRIQICVKKFNVTLHSLLWTHVFFVISLFTAIACQDITVTWNMKSNMTIFGKTAELECAISDYINSCNGNLRQWYGGKPYDFLCRNGDCRNSAKYFERKEAMCKYILTIYNFSINDINCEYTCSYGIHRSRKMLNLDGQHYTYVPSMNEVNYTVEEHDSVNATVFIPKVYPPPSCQAFFADNKISTITNTSSVGYFFATEIQIIYKPPVDKCKGVLNISCIIGSTYFTPVYQNVSICKGEPDFNRNSAVSTVTAIVIVILIILVVTLMSFLFYKKFGRNIRDNCKPVYIPASTINEDIPASTINQ